MPLLTEFLRESNINIDSLSSSLVSSTTPAVDTKNILKKAKSAFDDMFFRGVNIRDLIHIKSQLMDQLLSSLWARFLFNDNVSLIAVGGYGRGELHPHSDIDLLILVKTEINEELGEALTAFITLIWDLKLDIGHSVRTIEECIESAKDDVTICTNLLETRTISGRDNLLQAVSSCVYSDEVHTSKSYFLAKREEQSKRHQKYSGTEYNLEPNLKSSPGTLRDIQTIAWITKRHFGPDAPSTRSRYHFLTDEEFNMLDKGEAFLWRMRYGLQMIADRNENRLLFEYQGKLAEIMGFSDNEQKLAVEQMMQHYYRTVLGLAELADVILQYFDDFYINSGNTSSDKTQTIQALNKRFQLNNNYIETIDNGVFDRSPYALIEIFLLQAQNSQIKGIKSTTIRLIREHIYLIDDSFRHDLANTTLFMEILRTPHRLHQDRKSVV